MIPIKRTTQGCFKCRQPFIFLNRWQPDLKIDFQTFGQLFVDYWQQFLFCVTVLRRKLLNRWRHSSKFFLRLIGLLKLFYAPALSYLNVQVCWKFPNRWQPSSDVLSTVIILLNTPFVVLLELNNLFVFKFSRSQHFHKFFFKAYWDIKPKG